MNCSKLKRFCFTAILPSSGARFCRKLTLEVDQKYRGRTVAVARKLAVLLNKLWVSGEVYEPLRNNHEVESALA
jgi:hypothetical protein